MKKILHILAFPFILALSILKALLAKPFAFRLRKDGFEIGIVPLLLILAILIYI